MSFRKQRSGGGIYGGEFHGPVQLGGSQVNIHRHSARRLAVIFGTVVAAVLLTSGATWLGYRTYTSSDGYRIQSEEDLVSRLSPGQGYYRINQALGTEPHFSIKLSSGNRVHQYEREWETLQFVESPSGGTLAMAIYSKDPAFRPKVSLGGLSIQLNVTTLAEASPLGSPTAAHAYCGAHKGGYFEAHYPMPNAYRAQNIAVGASNAETEKISLSAPCGALDRSGCDVRPVKYDNELSESLAHCLDKSPDIHAMRKDLKASALIFTAPAEELVPDMLYPPDVVAGAKNLG
ncbi:hypothetical protein ACIRFF_14980 [Streptomyces cyaneofuscatus]